MKSLVCEMCGSSDIVKQDGLFVCQACGTKYSVEEARKMMIEGTVEVKGTVNVDMSGNIGSLQVLAKSALEGGNYGEACSYAVKILEIDSDNIDAWKIKMQSTARLNDDYTFNGNDVVTAGKRVIALSNNMAASEVYSFWLNTCLDVLKNCTSIMSNVGDVPLYAGDKDKDEKTAKAFKDDPVIQKIPKAINNVILLRKAVPNNVIGENQNFVQIAESIVKEWASYGNAEEKRFSLYDKKNDDNRLKKRRKVLEEIKEGLPEKIKEGLDTVIIFNSTPDFVYYIIIGFVILFIFLCAKSCGG